MNSLIFLFHSARDMLVVDKIGNIQQVTNYYPFVVGKGRFPVHI